MNALIVDDEPLARDLLGRMLSEQGVQVVGHAANAADGVALADDLGPDVVFLDIRMSGVSGIDATALFGQLEPPPLVVLVTGHSEYAVEAYSRSVFDYLLKPVSDERLQASLAKLRRHLSMQRRANRVGGLLRRPSPSAFLQRLPIRNRGSILLIQIERILYAAASGKSVAIRTRDASIQSSFTLAYLEHVLPPNFMRIHASCIVNIVFVSEILLLGNHSYAVKLVNGDELPLARHQYPRLQERLGLPSASP